MWVLSKIGGGVIKLSNDMGRFYLFVLSICLDLFSTVFKGKFYWGRCYNAILEDCICSLFVVAVSSVFIGSVLVLQIYNGFSGQYIEGVVAKIVAISVIKDLAPVFVGLLLAGRIGTAFSAKLASMEFTEQLEAMETLSVSVTRYLILPKVISSIFAFLVCYCAAVIFGIFGGYIVASSLGFNADAYLINTYEFVYIQDVKLGLLKSLGFGILIALLSAYFGLTANKGSQGVGSSATKAVVASTVWILLINYLVNWMYIDVL